MHNVAKLFERMDGDAIQWNWDVRTAVNESAH